MNMITTQKVNKMTKDLEQTLAKAKRRLFEFETFRSMYEHQTGKHKVHKSASSLIRDAKNA